MSVDIVFDMSRLALRFTRPAPNGIDRVDLAFARQFVSKTSDNPTIVLTVIGPRAVPSRAALAVIDALGTHWRETEAPERDPVFQWLKDTIVGDLASQPQPSMGRRYLRAGRSALSVARHGPLIGRRGLFPGRNPSRSIPFGATYVNVSQFPFMIPGAWRWLLRRPDIRAVFLIHDLLPITHPEFFPPREYSQHRTIVEAIAQLAHLIIVPSTITRHELIANCEREGLAVPEIEVIPLAVDENFLTDPVIDNVLSAQPYFIACGTIEPRKNHLLLLNVWRELALQLGAACPKLILAGARGWHNANVIDMLERCEPIAPHVIEVSGLSTPGLKRLMDNSRGLLMPSFAEGYGLPVAEACAAGVPILASDIPVFGMFGDGPVAYIDPVDGPAWLGAIKECSAKPPATMASRISARRTGRSTAQFFEHVHKLLTTHPLPRALSLERTQ